MEKAVQVYGISPDDLKNLLSQEVKHHLDEFKKSFQPKEPREYLSRQQVADLLDLDISTVQKWSREGKLNPLGIGSRVYFLRSDVESALKPVAPALKKSKV